MVIDNKEQLCCWQVACRVSRGAVSRVTCHDSHVTTIRHTHHTPQFPILSFLRNINRKTVLTPLDPCCLLGYGWMLHSFDSGQSRPLIRYMCRLCRLFCDRIHTWVDTLNWRLELVCGSHDTWPRPPMGAGLHIVTFIESIFKTNQPENCPEREQQRRWWADVLLELNTNHREVLQSRLLLRNYAKWTTKHGK